MDPQIPQEPIVLGTNHHAIVMGSSTSLRMPDYLVCYDDVAFLRNAYGSLKEQQTAILLGVNHHALTVGIRPDYLVCFDNLSNLPEVWRLIKNSGIPNISMNGPSDVEIDIRKDDMWFGSGSGGWAAWLGYLWVVIRWFCAGWTATRGRCCIRMRRFIQLCRCRLVYR